MEPDVGVDAECATGIGGNVDGERSIFEERQKALDAHCGQTTDRVLISWSRMEIASSSVSLSSQCWWQECKNECMNE